MEAGHRFLVRDVPSELVSLAVEVLERFQVESLALRRGLRGPFLPGGAQTEEHRAGRGDVLLGPERMVVAHRLAPVGESETGVDLLGVLERLAGLLEPEAMERRHAAQERILGFLRARVRKIDGSQVARRGA